MTNHFKTHGYVHCLWIIAILIGCLATFLVRMPNAELVQSYISFAATLASLLLALVAIFYAIISNQHVTLSVASAADTWRSAKDAIDNVERLSNNLVGKTDRLSEQFEKLSVNPLNYYDSVGASKPSDSENSDDDDPTKIPRVNNGGALCLYAICLANKSGKHIDFDVLKDEYDETFSWILFGYLTCLKAFSPLGIQIESAGENYQITSIGSLDVDCALDIKFIASESEMLPFKEKIDSYFGQEKADSSS